MKNKILTLITAAAVLLSVQCKKEECEPEPCVMSERCFIVPEYHPCWPTDPVYYYDQAEKRCKIIPEGLCPFVEIPFQTLEDCKNNCNCE